MRPLSILVFGTLAACSVEKMPPIRMVHRVAAAQPHRVVVVPTECTPSEFVTANTDPRAWCSGVDALVASELAFRGIEVVDPTKLPAAERSRQVIEVSSTVNGSHSEHRTVTVEGPTYSDVDMWTRRAGLEQMGIDGVVHVRAAHLATWPARTLALVRLTRPQDAAPIAASVCELEVSRLDSEAETVEKAVRCALAGLPR
jgi:hypothetical protein